MQTTTVRLSDNLYDGLRRKAFEERVSVNSLIVSAVHSTHWFDVEDDRAS